MVNQPKSTRRRSRGGRPKEKPASDSVNSVVNFKTNAWKNSLSAQNYHRLTKDADDVFQLVRRDLYMRYLQRFIKPGQRVLDVGCGSGLVTTALYDLGYHIVACDVSLEMLNHFRDEMGPRNIELRLGNAFDLPAHDQEFDAVISRMFMQHFPNWPAALREKVRVAKPGGIIYYDFANLEHITGLQERDESESFFYSCETKDREAFYAACSYEELQRITRELGVNVLEVLPSGLFFSNAQYWHACGPKAYNYLNETIGEHLVVPEVRECIEFLEENFVSRMPKHMTYGNITVLQKRYTKGARARTGREHLQAELERMTAERDRLQEESARATAGRDYLQAELERMTAARDRLQEESARATERRDSLQAELERLKGSKSWRFTGPLRTAWAVIWQFPNRARPKA